MVFGRVLGSGFGAAVAGLWGAIIGYGLGHLFDQGLSKGLSQNKQTNQMIHALFFETGFAMMGHLAKCQGRINEQSIQVARTIMNDLNLNEAQRLSAMRAFNAGKAKDFPTKQHLLRLSAFPEGAWPLKQLFLEMQIKAVSVNGAPNTTQLLILTQMAQALGFSDHQWRQWLYNHQQQYQHQQYNHRDRHPKSHDLEKQAYEMLGVSPSDNWEDIKKAYRRKMSEHHPDKLMAKGLPPEMIQLATEKTQQIQKAFETLEKQQRVAQTVEY